MRGPANSAGRTVLTPIPPESPELPSLSRLSLGARVYRALLRAIISGEYAPGTRVIDQDLARRMNVSRTPVREALQRLATEGLVDIRPGTYTRISALGPDDADIFPIVAEMHVLAIRLGLPRINSVDISKMRRLNTAMKQALAENDVFLAMELDSQFHGVPVEASRNVELSKLIASLEPKIRRIEFSSFGNRRHTSIHAHAKIIEACSANDGDEAERLVRENWLVLGDSLRETLERPAADL